MNTPGFPTSPVSGPNLTSGAAERAGYRFSGRRDSAHVSDQRTATLGTPSRPAAHRPRGRLLIAGLMLVACSAGIATVWNSLLRYRAYGVVTGRTIDVGVPVAGVLQSVHVCEGDIVRQDATLARVTDLESEQKLARLEDELRVADAALHAEIARLQWQSRVEETEMTRSIAEYLEADGRLQDESQSLAALRDQLARTQMLSDRHAAADSELRSQQFREHGQQEKLAGLERAVVALRERAEQVIQVSRPGAEQIQPLVAKSEMIMNEIGRMREWISQGEVRAPVNGVVLRRHRPAGECVRPQEALFTVVEESSAEIEIYLPQSMTSHYRIGDRLSVMIEPVDEPVPCVVTAIGLEHRAPPTHLEIFYRADVRLLPVRLRPTGKFAGGRNLTIGAVARLPWFAERS